ncbi:MAG TPA: AbrB/MazE/SpoVT family DNA-binding domain-containing protein [Nostocaceae cyanobacterium]|nr:AbrB/MazE/SpoVT family DNA-binding domain-containing protein [Nostocaceae cyanobacterium]
MYTLKTRKIGNSFAVTLPRAVLQKLRVKTNSIIHKNTANPNFKKAMAAYRKVSIKYRNALNELAK